MKEMIGYVTRQLQLSRIVQAKLKEQAELEIPTDPNPLKADNQIRKINPITVHLLDYALYDQHPAIAKNSGVSGDDQPSVEFFTPDHAERNQHYLSGVMEYEPHPKELGEVKEDLRARRHGYLKQAEEDNTPKDDLSSEDFEERIEKEEILFVDANAYHGTSLSAILKCNGDLGHCGKGIFNLASFLRQKFFRVQADNLSRRSVIERFGLNIEEQEMVKLEYDRLVGEFVLAMREEEELADREQNMKQAKFNAKVFDAGVEAIKKARRGEKKLDDNRKRLENLRNALKELLASDITAGDIVAIPFRLSSTTIDPDTRKLLHEGSLDIPVICDQEVSRLIGKLSHEKLVTVIVASGNSNVNLTEAETIKRIGPITEQRRPNYNPLGNTGSPSGAIIVGQGRKEGADDPGTIANYGTPVDAHLNGHVPSSRLEVLRKSADGEIVKEHKSGKVTLMGLDGTQSKKRREDVAEPRIGHDVDGVFLQSLGGSSASVMYAAAIIGTVQVYRDLAGWPLLKPYELRAHLRQWRSHMLTRERRDAPPNVIEWLIGTGVAKMVRYVSEADRKIMSDICVAAWEKDWDEADEIYTEEEYPTPQGGERPRLLMIKCPSPNS